MDTLLTAGLVNVLLAAALALLVCGLGRIRRRPALLHSLWLLVLLKLLAPPLLPLPVLPHQEKPAEEKPTRPATSPQSIVLYSEAPMPAELGNLRFETNLEPANPPLPARMVIRAVPATTRTAVTVDVVMPAPEEAIPDEEQTETAFAFPWAATAGLWLGGAAFCLGWALWGLLRFRRLLRHAELAPEAIQEQVKTLAGRMGLKRSPPVWLLPGPLPPFVWAVFGRVRLYFPRGLLARLDDDGRASLLAHELAHVCRRDHWLRWLELLAGALYWWCPLVWWARARLRACEEECCDAWVVELLPARAYAGAILEAVDFLAAPAAMPALASGLGRVEALKKRLIAIMEKTHPKNIPTAGKLVVLLLACLLPVLPTRAKPAEKKPAEPVKNEAEKPPVPMEESGQFENHGFNILGGESDVWSLAASSSGRYLAAGLGWWDRPGEVRLWDLARPTPLFAIPEKLGVASVAFSPDGTLLATSGWDQRVRLRQVPSGREVRTIALDSVARLAFSPDGKLLATVTETKKAQLWDVASGALVRTLQGDMVRFHTVAFSPDGTQLAVGGGEWNEGGIRHVLLFEKATGKQVRKLAHPQPVLSVAYSPDDKTLATGGLDAVLRLWDVAEEKVRFEIAQPPGELQGVARWIEGLSFAPDGKTLVSSAHDGCLRVWDAETGKDRGGLGEGLARTRTVCFLRDGKTIAAGGAERTVRLWDASSKRETATLQRGGQRSGGGPILALAGSPDGKLIAAALENKTVQLRDAYTGELRGVLRGHEEAVTCLAFAPDGKTIATGSPDHSIRLWDAATGKHNRTLEGHTSWVYALAWSRDGGTLATAGYDRTIRLWDAKDDFREQATLKGHTASVRALAFSADGLTLVSGGSDRTARLWDLKKNETRLELKGHEGTVRGVAFSPDGKRVATASEDGTARLWDSVSGQALTTLKGHKGEVWSVAFSPGGRSLATSGADGTGRVWDPGTGKERTLLTGHGDGVTGLIYSPDGQAILTASLDSGVRRWAASPLPQGMKTSLQIGGDVWFAEFVPEDRPIVLIKKDGTLQLWPVKVKRIALMRETIPMGK